MAGEEPAIWNKLVRDRIPEIIRREGRTSETRQLDLTSFVAALKEKLVEESREAVQAETTSELLVELADVLEVLSALAAAHNISVDDIEATRARRQLERGGFCKRLFLLSTSQNDAIVDTARDPRTERLYELVQSLPRFNWQTPHRELPADGIYLFFEREEHVEWRGKQIDRIVRVGTHNRDGNFRSRIRQHYGTVKTLGGNKNGSVFRKHVGGALMRRDDPGDNRLTDWLRQMGPSYREVEQAVSSTLRETFTFSCFRVDIAEERLSLESGLIALLAQHPVDCPSPNWLGQYAANEKIRRSGLWNTQRLDVQPLSLRELERCEELRLPHA